VGGTVGGNVVGGASVVAAVIGEVTMGAAVVAAFVPPQAARASTSGTMRRFIG
jgi:hypothetical protein